MSGGLLVARFGGETELLAAVRAARERGFAVHRVPHGTWEFTGRA